MLNQSCVGSNQALVAPIHKDYPSQLVLVLVHWSVVVGEGLMWLFPWVGKRMVARRVVGEAMGREGMELLDGEKITINLRQPVSINRGYSI